MNENQTTQTNLLEFTPDDLVELPKNEVVDGVVVNLAIRKAKDVFGENAINPEQDVLEITYEIIGYNMMGKEFCNYYPKGKVSSKSKLGRIIKRYGGLKVGMRIKVDFDSEGNHKILI